MANKKLTPCEWCLDEQKKFYGENEIYDSEDSCSFRCYCSKNSMFGKKISKKDFDDFMRKI